MDDYSCNQCLKTYRFRRNLNRHISECHQEVDWWRCTEFRCNSKFKRRIFLFTHLAQTHQFKKHVAREKVLYAQRSSIINQSTSYYEDISSDEDILEILNADSDDEVEYIMGFNMDMLGSAEDNVSASYRNAKDNVSASYGNAEDNVSASYRNA